MAAQMAQNSERVFPFGGITASGLAHGLPLNILRPSLVALASLQKKYLNLLRSQLQFAEWALSLALESKETMACSVQPLSGNENLQLACAN